MLEVRNKLIRHKITYYAYLCRMCGSEAEAYCADLSIVSYAYGMSIADHFRNGYKHGQGCKAFHFCFTRL